MSAVVEARVSERNKICLSESTAKDLGTRGAQGESETKQRKERRRGRRKDECNGG